MLLKFKNAGTWEKPEVILREIQTELYVLWLGDEESTARRVLLKYRHYLDDWKETALEFEKTLNTHDWIIERFYYAFPSLQLKFENRKALLKNQDEVIRHVKLFFNCLEQLKLHDKRLVTVYRETACMTTTHVLALLCLMTNIRKGYIEVQDDRRTNAL
ncbi:hypothetical protein [Psittacicella hinzii]|uniref:Uncharacterized protein n=1 Tax=Psittacicella hinzii TaxID=2028575 RepID=A0A3A1YIH3_9GAMM|nr:hypothetical protein [Psittacicella hinzii]RIY37475.1 hypothetical protein CKF58_04965 [Psittacicella hinzii]